MKRITDTLYRQDKCYLAPEPQGPIFYSRKRHRCNDYRPSSSRTICAPALNAANLPLAIWRDNGAMPQFVHG